MSAEGEGDIFYFLHVGVWARAEIKPMSFGMLAQSFAYWAMQSRATEQVGLSIWYFRTFHTLDYIDIIYIGFLVEENYVNFNPLLLKLRVFKTWTFSVLYIILAYGFGLEIFCILLYAHACTRQAQYYFVMINWL